MKTWGITYILVCLLLSSNSAAQETTSHIPYKTELAPVNSPALPYLNVAIPKDSNVQINIPKEMRIPNRTRIQCVWCSIETIGRYNHIKSLYNLTYNDKCKSYSDPHRAKAILDSKKVKYKMISYRSGDYSFLKEHVQKNKNPVAFGIHTTHMMTMVHFSEEEGIVRFIDNSDPSLEVRTWTMERFKQAWDGWAIVVFGDRNDSPIHRLPIVDENGKVHRKYYKDYIPVP